MANILDWLQTGGKIKQSDLSARFSKYGDKSPLELALLEKALQEPAAGVSAAASPPSEVPSADLAEQDRLAIENARAKWNPPPSIFSMEGEGPRYPQIPASLRSSQHRAEQQTQKQAQEHAAITKYILNTSELKGRSPNEFLTLKDAQREAENIRKAKPNPLKQTKAEVDLKLAQERLKKAQGEVDFKTGISTGAVTGASFRF